MRRVIGDILPVRLRRRGRRRRPDGRLRPGRAAQRGARVPGRGVRPQPPRSRPRGSSRARQPQNLSYSAPSEGGEAEVKGSTVDHGRRPVRQGRPQRAVPLRLGQEVQDVPRPARWAHRPDRPRRRRLTRPASDTRRRLDPFGQGAVVARRPFRVHTVTLRELASLQSMRRGGGRLCGAGCATADSRRSRWSALAALLTTSLCLGPLYQRAMEQALAGSVLANATPEQRALRLDSRDLSADRARGHVPGRARPLLRRPGRLARRLRQRPAARTRPSRWSPGCTPWTGPASTSRWWTAAARPHAGEVMVSTADVETNGWTVGSKVASIERLDAGQFDVAGRRHGDLVGVYEPPAADDRLVRRPAHRPGRDRDPGRRLRHRRLGHLPGDHDRGAADWRLAPGLELRGVVAGRRTAVDHDSLVRIGPVVDQVRQETVGERRHIQVVAVDRPARPERARRDRQRAGPDDGRGPGRAAAGPGGGGALDGAGRGHRRPPGRARAGQASRARSPGRGGVPPLGAAAAHPARRGGWACWPRRS